MFKERKTNTVLLGLVVILAILLTTPLSEAASLDIERISLTWAKGHLDGTPEPSDKPWLFEIWLQFANTGNLDYVEVSKPGCTTPFTTIYQVNGDWDYRSPDDYFSLETLQTDYPSGSYNFDFYDSSKKLLNSVTLEDSGDLSQPSSPVDFIYPEYDGQTGIPTNPTFTWTVNPNAGDALWMSLLDCVVDENIYESVPASMGTLSWSPGSLQPNHYYDLTVSVFNAKDLGIGPTLPTMNIGGDTFEYCLMIEYLNEITFTTAPAGTLSGWVWVEESSDYGYSLSENDLVYFVSFGPVWNYNFTTGEWAEEGTVGWIFADWPFFYDLAKNSLMFALPPESGLWVYHFSTDQWELLPRIIPW